MFPFSKRSTRTVPPSTGNQLFKRTLALGAGLFLLWLAINIMPRPDRAVHKVSYSDEAGAVASSKVNAASQTGASWDLGKITAGLLLCCLISFAVYWRKKAPLSQMPANTLHNIGKIQLSPNQHVHLIGCGPDALLVGTSNGQITLLHQLPLQKLAAREEAILSASIKIPAYSDASSTLRNNLDFGILLQQHQLASGQVAEATKTI